MTNLVVRLFCFMSKPEENFIQYIKHHKSYSSHTVVAYENDLVQFKKYIEEVFELDSLKEVKRDMIRSWVVTLIKSDVSSTTVNRKVSALKSFYKYLRIEGEVKSNPTFQISIPKQKKKLPEFIPESDMKAGTINIQEDQYSSDIMEDVIISLLYGTGIRLSELIGLTLNDVNFAKNSIKVMGKRQKERIIPLPKKVLCKIEKYITYRTETFENPEPFLFLTKQGKKLYPKFVYRLVNTYIRSASTISKKSPHVLRHSFATHMLNNGADLNTIKELLGHASLAATQVYTHNTVEKLKNIYSQAHPRGE